MSRMKLREAIAVEAARLMLRGKESEFATARKRAARWLSRRKLNATDLPSNAEIQNQVYVLAGLFADEHQTAAIDAIRGAALDLMDLLADFVPRVSFDAIRGPVMAGSELTMTVVAESPEVVADVLENAGFHTRLEAPADEAQTGRLRITHRYPCEIVTLHASADDAEREGVDSEELGQLIREAHVSREQTEVTTAPVDDAPAPTDEHEYHADTFAMLRMLLERLEQVQLDREQHPEGDALYHSLQVYELGLEARPYDEEFLLACLLHDVGLGIDRRNPVSAAMDVLGGLLTQRTCWLIEHRREARDYLRTGRIPRSIRRNEHFDELVLLAQCDLAGRVPGARVSDLDEALEYIAGLGSAWDDV